MVMTTESDGHPETSSLALSSPVDLRPHRALLIHTPQTLQSTQAAQSQPLHHYFQSELYHEFSCKARKIIERVEADRRREEDLNKPVFRPTKHVKPLVQIPEFRAFSRTRKPLISPDSSPPLIRRPLEHAALPADLYTEKVKLFIAKPFNTVCSGIHGYDDKFPILMAKPPAENDLQSSDFNMKQQNQQHKGSLVQKLSAQMSQKTDVLSKEKLCVKTQEELNQTNFTRHLDCAFAINKSSSDQEKKHDPPEALEFFKLLPDRALAQIFCHLDTQSLGALKSTCQDFKCLIEVYEVGASDARWLTDPEYSQDTCQQYEKVFNSRM